MSYMTIFVQEAAMATMELKRAASREVCVERPGEQKPEHKAWRMSWVVVTDQHGRRTLRSHWSVR